MAENAQISAQHAEGEPTLAHRIVEKIERLKFVILAVLVVLIAVVAIFSYQRRASEKRETQAENDFFRANIDLLGTGGVGAIDTFGKLAKDFVGLPTGARALISQYSFAFNTGEHAVAETAMRQFIKEYPKHPFAGRAKLALAQVVIAQGQDRLSEGVGLLQEVVSTAGNDILAESKLALAQALELEAEAVKDNPDEYHTRLRRAESEYTDIVGKARSGAYSAGFWPQSVVVPADFALVVIKDKLNGHEHPAPVGVQPPATPAQAGQPIMAIPPPPADETTAVGAEDEGEGDAAEASNTDDADSDASPEEDAGPTENSEATETE